jgi:hypothetical protein
MCFKTARTHCCIYNIQRNQDMIYTSRSIGMLNLKLIFYRVLIVSNYSIVLGLFLEIVVYFERFPVQSTDIMNICRIEETGALVQFGNTCIILHCKNIISNSDCPSGCRVHVFMFLYLQLVCNPFIACQLRSQLRFQNFYCALIVILPLFSTEGWSHTSRVDNFSASVRNTTQTHRILKLHVQVHLCMV